MTDLTLVIGNRNYSSWSMRPWVALRMAEIPFGEEVVPLYEPESKAKILHWSPSGLVPVLIDDSRHVWESLAIIEYVAERFPESPVWPADAGARAYARSVCSEMHAGFRALRTNMPMNIRARGLFAERTPEVEADIARILKLWSECRRWFGAEGPFLFGKASAADAFFAPVVTRFRTYGVTLEGAAADYAEAAWTHPAVTAFRELAVAEPWRIAKFEK